MQNFNQDPCSTNVCFLEGRQIMIEGGGIIGTVCPDHLLVAEVEVLGYVHTDLGSLIR